MPGCRTAAAVVGIVGTVGAVGTVGLWISDVVLADCCP